MSEKLVDLGVVEIKTVTFANYCLCGAALRGTMPPVLAETLLAEWNKIHTGTGHGPATAKQARSARRKSDKEPRIEHE